MKPVWHARAATGRTLDLTRTDAENMLRVATVVRQLHLDCQAPFENEQVHVWVCINDFF